MKKKYEKYDEEFYNQLLDYLEDTIEGLSWNNLVLKIVIILITFWAIKELLVLW